MKTTHNHFHQEPKRRRRRRNIEPSSSKVKMGGVLMRGQLAGVLFRSIASPGKTHLISTCWLFNMKQKSHSSEKPEYWLVKPGQAIHSKGKTKQVLRNYVLIYMNL